MEKICHKNLKKYYVLQENNFQAYLFAFFHFPVIFTFLILYIRDIPPTIRPSCHNTTPAKSVHQTTHKYTLIYLICKAPQFHAGNTYTLFNE